MILKCKTYKLNQLNIPHNTTHDAHKYPCATNSNWKIQKKQKTGYHLKRNSLAAAKTPPQLLS